MRIIEVESCPKCPYREGVTYYNFSNGKHQPCCVYPHKPNVLRGSGVIENTMFIDKRTKTFPKFCPLKEIQIEKDD